ncbi:probable bifunctional dTTP/UTP pyrophosphatase/methyltransferase protein [Talpa occidentalis]|uniref:probable bifunctional dTTP/UTP pyrophosphatase/methyltransferase protein n=1 Tax=Talpa occidentalis TaxID=50954 RepID=UPI00188FAE4F|nr:probable bifunctional dTTP/UTP pyrophosphatase/methyltransferase protein [Talpa occidentalis]
MVLSPVLRKLQGKRVVLASASPRRREILSNAGLRFEVVPSRFKERLSKASFRSPDAYAMETARQKALEVAARMHQKDLRTPDVVIGADTIVTVDGLILEKPVDKQDAYRMLSRLSGKEHSVFTGVAIVHCSSRDGQLDTEVSSFFEETRVCFSKLSEALLWEYIDSGEPMDKAGGYGIQALGGMLVEAVRGDFLNVVGFPLNRFCKQLARLYPPDGPAGGGSAPAPSEGVGGLDGAGAQDADCNGAPESPGVHPKDLLELIDGFKASKALFTACRMKVFDLLRDEAPLKAGAIAGKIDASLGGTQRLLDACVALGVLEKTERGYSNAAPARLYLVSDAERSLHSLVLHRDAHDWALFTQLEAAVRQGACQDPGDGPFQDPSQRSPETQLRFLQAMHSLAQLTAPQVATAFDLSRFTSACDLGGGTGALAHALARAYPRLQVTVLDLPEVVQEAPRFQPSGGPAGRVRFVPGDFFQDDLPEADLYVLSGVLQHWPDERAHQLLSRVAGRCPPGAGLLLVETALDTEQRAARLRTLDVLLQARGGARPRAELERLLRAHGFGDVRAASAGGLLDVLLGIRASA